MARGRAFEVRGTVAPGWEGVKEAFVENFEERGEVGASCCVYQREEKKVDLWGGVREVETGSQWEADTLVPVFSLTKGMSSMATALAHSRGWLDFDERVATYWPEFSQNGKEEITVRQLFAHQAGLSALDEPITLEIMGDFERLDAILARQKPAHAPGVQQAYHCWNIAWYQSALLQRVDPKGRRLGQFFREEIAEPLGADFHIGLPDEVPDSAVAQLIPYQKIVLMFRTPWPFLIRIIWPWSLASRTLLNPSFVANKNNFNKREVWSVEMGAGGGMGSARGIARAFSEFATGGKTLKLRTETLEELERPPIPPSKQTADLVFGLQIPFSLGFIKQTPGSAFAIGGDARSYGSFGAGGSGGFADPENHIGFGYALNKMGVSLANDKRESALSEAVYRAGAAVPSNAAA
jgi:CubicO group peptidase (beta-lactamase class C family)